MGRDEVEEIELEMWNAYQTLYERKAKEVIDQVIKDEEYGIPNSVITARAMVETYTSLEQWANFMRKDWESNLHKLEKG